MKSSQAFDGPTIFYHEDDFRQVELLPNDSWKQLKVESSAVNSFANENFDGYGFTDIYVRNDTNKIKLSQRQIQTEDLELILSSLDLDRITNVLTGYGQTHSSLHQDCVAFSKNHQTIYYDFKEGIVQNIWLTNHWGMDREKLAMCLYNLGQRWGLLLQDWNLSATIDLGSKDSIDNYLATHDNE